MDHPDDPLDLQQSLVESSLPLVFETYDAAVAEGFTQPLVVLVDCEDEIGGALARAWVGDDAVDDAVAHHSGAEADGEPTTVFARAIAWDDATADLSAAFPYLGPILKAPPPEDGVLVIGVTAGGASALTAPWDARP